MRLKFAGNGIFFTVVFALLLAGKGVSADVFSIRAHAGIGAARSASSGYTGRALHAGARFLLNACNNKSYGIETTWFNLVDSGDMVVAGFILQNKLRSWFHMSIGTVGYFNFAGTGDHTAGVTTNLGWEPAGMTLTPLIALRNDIVFYDKVVFIQSISFALSW